MNTMQNNASLADREPSWGLPELYLTLRRRKSLFFVVFFVLFIAGSTYVFLRPSVYKYSQILQLPHYVAQSTIVTFENPAVTTAKLTEYVIPSVLKQYHDTALLVKVRGLQKEVAGQSGTVSLPSSYVNLQGKGRLSTEKQYVMVFQAILSELNQDQQHLLEMQRKKLQARLSANNAMLSTAQVDQSVLQKSLDHAQAVLLTLAQQAGASKAKELTPSKSFAIKDVGMMRSGSASNQTVDVINALTLNTAFLKQEISHSAAQVLQLSQTYMYTKLALSSMQPAHFVSPISRFTSHGFSKRSEMIIVLFLSVFLAILFAMCWEWLVNFFMMVRSLPE